MQYEVRLNFIARFERLMIAALNNSNEKEYELRYAQWCIAKRLGMVSDRDIFVPNSPYCALARHETATIRHLFRAAFLSQMGINYEIK